MMDISPAGRWRAIDGNPDSHPADATHANARPSAAGKRDPAPDLRLTARAGGRIPLKPSSVRSTQAHGLETRWLCKVML